MGFANTAINFLWLTNFSKTNSVESEFVQSVDYVNRRFRNKCDIVEEPNSSNKHGIRVIFSP